MKTFARATAFLGLGFAFSSWGQYYGQQQQGYGMPQQQMGYPQQGYGMQQQGYPQVGQYPQASNTYNAPSGYQPQPRQGEQPPQTILANGEVKVKCAGNEDGYRYAQTRVQGGTASSSSSGSDH